MNELKKAFLDSIEAQKHFRDPLRCWEEAMKFNDGGITYLRESLRPLCNPELKRSQIQSMVRERLVQIVSRLQPYFRTDNKEKEREKKAILSKTIAGILAKIVQEQRFGDFLHKLQMKDHNFYDLYFQVESQWLNQADQDESNFSVDPSTTMGVRTSADDILGELGLLGNESAPKVSSDQRATPSQPSFHTGKPKDEAEYFAGLIEKAWIEHIHSIADSQIYQNYFKFPAEQFSQFAHELIVGAIRIGLRNSMEEAIRKASRYRNIRREKIVWKQVSLAANIINSFINWLGFDRRQLPPEKCKVTISGKERILFIPPVPIKKYPTLGEDQTPFDKQFYTDWLAALITLVMANVDFDGENTLDPEQNKRLGDILDRLAPSAQTT